jgi:hypothetical protein
MGVLAQAGPRRHLWRDWFNGPLYVPDEGRFVLNLLESDGPSGFLGELERLSTLGSPWASAILGYLALMPGPDGKRDTERAVELCKNHAHAGDSYAQFVYAWACLFAGDGTLAYESMKKAMLSRFPPATMDFTNFVWNGWGTKEPYPKHALRALRHADRVGHRAALQWRCFFYKSGRVGFVRRPFGYLLAPIAWLRYFLALWRDPFSCRVFVFKGDASGPLLRPTPRFVSPTASLQDAARRTHG